MNTFNLLITAASEFDHTAGYQIEHAHTTQICPCSVAAAYGELALKTVIAFPKTQDPQVLDQLSHSFKRILEVFVSPNAKGALISALFCIEHISLDSPLIITGGNSRLAGGVLPQFKEFISSKYDSAVLTFEGSKPCWSYVEIDHKNNAVEFHEKRVVGNVASTGIVMFKNGNLFLEAAKWALLNNAQEGNRFYISSALNYLIAEGKTVQILQVPGNRYQHNQFGKGE